MYPRFVQERVEQALSDTRVVLISGPRQSGKTTLATGFASRSVPYISLDDATVLGSAIDDPVSFVRGLKTCTWSTASRRGPQIVSSA